MYEESQQANTRLKGDLEKVRNELVSTKKKFEEALKVKFFTQISKSSYIMGRGEIKFLRRALGCQ